MTLLFSFPGYENLTLKISKNLGLELGDALVRHFPDGESFVKINTDVKDKNIIIVCGLDNPNQKAMPLMFFSHTAKEFGAKRIQLVAPYLGYMRQDKRFNPGEAITSRIFAQFLSGLIDKLITVDPHLHRYTSLDEIYTIKAHVVHATDAIASWIKNAIKNPLLIGPDSESKQWVSAIADAVSAPYITLTKIRHGDKDVDISFPKIERYKDHTPILIDDIISTGTTMIKTTQYLQKEKMNTPVCIGIHGIFAKDAYSQLIDAGADKIITCNTIPHESNKIDISAFLAGAIKELDLEKS